MNKIIALLVIFAFPLLAKAEESAINSVDCWDRFDSSFYLAMGYSVLSMKVDESATHRIRNNANSDRFRIIYKLCKNVECVKAHYESAIIVDKYWGIVSHVGACVITIETEVYNAWLEGRTAKFASIYRKALAELLNIDKGQINKFGGINRFSGSWEYHEK